MAINKHIKYCIFTLIMVVTSNIFAANVCEDMKSIVKCFESNIEYYELNPRIHDPLYFYEPYSQERNNIISVDTIIYKPDSLMAVAFVVINDTLKNYYDAKAVICYRKNEDECFQIYPILVLSVIHHNNIQRALSLIKEYYFNELHKQVDRYGFEYRYNIGDHRFWSESLFFKKNKSKYYFELFYKLNNFESEYGELNYVKCNCQ